ncbi:MAG: pantoate--beta-alanine ligase, partial [Acidobacteriia bacterium]|nr:pantoate--beta-alanine ligase [Terriglobia bacterium]
METIHTVAWMKQVAAEARRNDRVLGFVPTMGALHEGHLSLVRAAQKQCSPVAVSIFVNPKQFGPSEDLQKYPRTFEADRAALEAMGVDYVFAPPPEEMYPAGFRTFVDVEGLSERLEGRTRPGHFRGVATVVLKLFEIVQPRFSFFGRKDAQQVRILQQMTADLNLSTEIVVCPIVREADGLAMSSRNAYLKEGDRRAATAISRSLEAVRREVSRGERDAVRLLAELRRVLDAEPGVAPDYAEIVDADTFEPVRS